MTEQREPSRLAQLEAENVRLRRLLAEAGIPFDSKPRSDEPANRCETAHRAQPPIDRAVNDTELLNRARNTLGMVRAIMRRSAETSLTAEDFARHLEGRVGAIARVQCLTHASACGSTDLHTLIADELLAHRAREGEQVHLDGPKMRVLPKAAELLALAVHELATNAIEHGALSKKDGSVRATWKVVVEPPAAVDAEPLFAFSWRERGMTDLQPPSRRGFGTQVLEDTLAYELEAATTLAYERTGLVCTVSLPLTPRFGMLVEEAEDREARDYTNGRGC